MSNNEKANGIITEINAAHASGKRGTVGELSGYALKFDSPSVENGPFVEYISRNALANVDLTKVLALFEHDYSKVLGRVDAGTLKLNVDNVGLHFVLEIADTTFGKDVYNNVKVGNLKNMSFGFVVAKGGDTWKQGKKPVRIINEFAELKEISVVSVPAYDDTDVLVTRNFAGNPDDLYREKVKLYLDMSLNTIE
ncbi:HK97 family phage prohead protease [Weissella confusa]